MTSVTQRNFLVVTLSVAASLVLYRDTFSQNPQQTARSRPAVTVGSQGPLPVHAQFTKEQIEAGNNLFLQNCAFCHGKEAGGGESGPDLTRSKIVSLDNNGENIGPVIRGGRPDKGMPPFSSLDDARILGLVAFIHAKQDQLLSQTGNRKGVDDVDLQTGNAAAGRQYFEGAGGCSKCHSAIGDLAGVATRYSGLRLEMQMLYPRDVKEKISVKTPGGETLNGILEYQDEFTIGMRDSHGTYHSWPVNTITFQVDDPLQAHVNAFSKYTDEDIHNVLAYIQTLK
jgi:cytochrome c oxidase cbb3-type subunit 3